MKKEATIYLNIDGIGEKDKEFFENKYSHLGINSRLQWYSYNIHKQKGATRKQNVKVDKHVRSTKGQGGSSDYPGNNKGYSGRKNKRYVPPPFAIENIFDFSYEDMIKCEPNKKFNKVLHLVFNHDYYDDEKNTEQEKWIEKLESLEDTGQLKTINEIYQRLSTYIKNNKLSRKWIDGSVICNIAIMISEYLRCGYFNYDYDFLNNIQKYNENDDFRFHLWLLRQCFINHNVYFHKYIAGIPDVNWWALFKFAHRYSNKDMKTKAQCCGFKDDNGKYIFRKF